MKAPLLLLGLLLLALTGCGTMNEPPPPVDGPGSGEVDEAAPLTGAPLA